MLSLTPSDELANLPPPARSGWCPTTLWPDEIATFEGGGGGEPAGGLANSNDDADVGDILGVHASDATFENTHVMVWPSGDVGKSKREAPLR